MFSEILKHTYNEGKLIEIKLTFRKHNNSNSKCVYSLNTLNFYYSYLQLSTE